MRLIFFIAIWLTVVFVGAGLSNDLGFTAWWEDFRFDVFVENPVLLFGIVVPFGLIIFAGWICFIGALMDSILGWLDRN